VASPLVRQCPTVEAVAVSVYEVPTDQPEADGTLQWSSTTVVVVEVRAGGHSGLGWTYAGAGSATVINEKLTDVCIGSAPVDVPAMNERMARACRNLGRAGLVACAISAVDIAAWDLKARLLELPLHEGMGVPVRNSGQRPEHPSGASVIQAEAEEGRRGP
jgi:L-alanine-DL-glutamate epimerase-like enolase superfamily enzyme